MSDDTNATPLPEDYATRPATSFRCCSFGIRPTPAPIFSPRCSVLDVAGIAQVIAGCDANLNQVDRPRPQLAHRVLHLVDAAVAPGGPDFGGDEELRAEPQLLHDIADDSSARPYIGEIDHAAATGHEFAE
jgi:hypothetical protein